MPYDLLFNFQDEKNIRPLDYGHSAVQYQKLQEALRSEEAANRIEDIKKIVKVTNHGLERLLERGFTAEDISSLLTKPDYLKTQSDGAKVFIQKIEDGYRMMILNEATGEVVTALRKTTLNKIVRLGENYGWKL